MTSNAGTIDTMNNPDLTIVVLTWNEIELTRRCIASVRANTDVDYELIVVDNGSEPAAAGEVQELADSTILNSSNHGFAAGMNQGLNAATGRLVVFLNNDTEVPRLWASRLVATFDGHADAGIVVPAVTAAGNQISVRSEPGHDIVTLPPFRHLASAVLYLMRRDTAQKLGGWGEEYQIASREDLDLLFKVWCNGLAVLLDERVLVQHVSNATAQSQLPDRDAIWQRNRDVFINKWTTATATDIPRLPSCDMSLFESRLEQAATVAFWMQQRFDLEDALVATRSSTNDRIDKLKSENQGIRRELARLTKVVGQPSRMHRSLAKGWERIRPLVPTTMREKLFSRFRSSYYRANPDKLFDDGRGETPREQDQ